MEKNLGKKFHTNKDNEYFTFKNTQIASSTKKKLKVFQKRIENFENVYGTIDIKNIDKVTF